jgi:hypothetical protein
MIKVNICGTTKVYDSSLASWINEQYNNRKNAGVKFWFIIIVEASGIGLSFRSASAPHGKSVPYHFNQKEQNIIDMWNDMGVKQEKNVGVLLRFLNRLQRIVD